jgi:nicotinate phosphoribosyltransferase
MGADGRLSGDILSLEADQQPGTALIEPVMRAGKRLKQPTLADSRARAARELAQLPEPLRRLQDGVTYPVTVADSLTALAAEADRAIGRR